ncbi:MULTISPECIES: GPW/gp25 family protein [unclassified Isoptericola]|uniref:GPW/gp25 family protein n=1 Tax=unclassified Isoptericola TaxID=2623355 RepID=UPI0027143133|nr:MULTISPECIES: GPW/gp25 family protein [unclassified Isoptericola]MDO8144903.1 GPW/gp25 family protein [Isoptericola sp. 178]MDO8152617.1 GPW/gp25 family protein [Isoptericola sp. b408]
MTDDVPRRAWAPRHLAFPLRLDGRGRTAMADDAEYVRGLVEQVLFTAPGERVNRPDFGSGVGRLVFAPTDDALAHSTQALVHGALQRWLGDLLQVEEVRVTSVDSRLEVVVEYLPLSATAPEERRTVTVSGGAP